MSIFTVDTDVINPLLPEMADVAWSAFVAVAIVAAIAALISISRNRQLMGGGERVAWVAICLVLAVVGPAVWFVVGRPGVQEQARTGRP